MSFKPLKDQSIAELISSLIEAYFETGCVPHGRSGLACNGNDRRVEAVRDHLEQALRKVIQ